MKDPKFFEGEDGVSFWQPEPANGYVTVKVSPWFTPGITFSQGLQVLPPGGMVREHAHEIQEETIFIISGRGRAEVDGKDVSLLPGTTVFLPPKIRHCFINEGNEELRFLWTVTPAGLEDFFKTIGRPRDPKNPCTAPEPFSRPKDPAIDNEFKLNI